jgi:hypothetical protein
VCEHAHVPVSGIDHVAISVADGPVGRPAANRAMGTSVSFRDPGGNLLELLTLDGSR